MPETATRTSTSYEALRAAIVLGDLAPHARLVEADLSAAFAMSRGEVRTALIRLEHEGLVVRELHRGARVRHVSEGEAVEILEARAVLEGLAVRRTAERIDGGGIARLEACLSRQRELVESGYLIGASDANADFHAALLEISAHETAIRLIRGLNAQTVRYQFRTVLVPGRPAESLNEHAEIFDAVIGRDGEGAEQAVRAHLFAVAAAVLRRSATMRPRSRGSLA